MAKYIGRLVDVGMGRETTRGVGVAPTYWVPRISWSFDDKIISARAETGVGSLADSLQTMVTTQYGQGDMEGEVRDQHFGLLLYALLGSYSVSGPTDSAYTHSFSLLQSVSHPSLTFFVQDPNTNETYELVMLDSLEITVELDSIVKYTASFMGKKGQTYTPARTVTYTYENKFSKKHLFLKLATTIGGLAAASALSVKRFRLTFAKNVELDDALGTAEPEDILNKQFSVEGELELNYTDETFKNYMRDGSYRAMEFRLNNTDTLIGVSSTPQLIMQFPRLDFFDWEPDNGLDDIVHQTISFKANKDLAAGLEIISTCQLINAVTTY